MDVIKLPAQFLRPLGEFELYLIGNHFALTRSATLISLHATEAELVRAAKRAFDAEIDRSNRHLLRI